VTAYTLHSLVFCAECYDTNYRVHKATKHTLEEEKKRCALCGEMIYADGSKAPF